MLLVMDEIAIGQHVEWDGENYHGFIDMGDRDKTMIVCLWQKKP